MKVFFIFAALLSLAAAQEMMTGGQHSFQATLQDVPVAYATKSINEYFLRKDSNAKPRAAEKIISATSQVVAGVLYRYKIEVTGGDKNEICDVTVLVRSWLRSPDNYQNQGVSCTEKNVAPAPKGMLLGGWQTADWNDDIVQQALSHLVKRVNSGSNSMYRLLPSGGVVTKQVVNGVNFRFRNVNMVETTCRKSATKDTLSFTDCPANVNSVTVPQQCEGEVYWNIRNKVHFTVKTSVCKNVTPAPKGMLLGGWQTADWNDDIVQQALSHLVKRVNSGSNSMYRLLPSGGVVTKQVVNGVNFRFRNVNMVETTCRKSATKDTLSFTDCPANVNSVTVPQQCEGEVYWNIRNKVHFTVKTSVCKNVTPAPKGMLLGGWQTADWNDDIVQQALSHLVKRVNSGSNSMYRLLPSGGVVTKQVVNGVNFRFRNVNMVETTCRKSATKDTLSFTDCPANVNSVTDPQQCEGEVYWNTLNKVPFTVKTSVCKSSKPSPKKKPDYTTLTARMDDDDVQRALVALVDRINSQCNCLYRKIPTTGTGNVAKKVSNGMTYVFSNLKMVETTCTNTDHSNYGKITLAECPKKANSQSKLSDCSGEVSWSPLAAVGSRFTIRKSKC